MPTLYTSKHIIRTLEKAGFYFVSQKGSHLKMRKITSDTTLTVIIPANKKSIPYGTFRSIVRQAQLDITDFE